MRKKVPKKQCSFAKKLEIIDFYSQHGAATTLKTYPEVKRSTLYAWLKRHEIRGTEGLQSISRRPKHLRKSRLTYLYAAPIIEYKQKHPNFSCQRIQTYLIKNKNYNKISISTIWRVLKKYQQLNLLVNVLETIIIKN